ASEFLPSGAIIVGNPFGSLMMNLSIGLGFFVLLLAAVFIIRSMQQQKKVIAIGPTWGCGYPLLTPEHQYTATTLADNLNRMGAGISGVETHYIPIDRNDIFPAEKRTYTTHQYDRLEKFLILKPSKFLLGFMERFVVLRSGKIQHYILY